MSEIRKNILFPNRMITEEKLKKREVQESLTFHELLLLCQEFNVLPLNGGLLDQDSYFVFLLKYALACQHERRELDERRMKNAA